MRNDNPNEGDRRSKKMENIETNKVEVIPLDVLRRNKDRVELQSRLNRRQQQQHTNNLIF